MYVVGFIFKLFSPSVKQAKLSHQICMYYCVSFLLDFSQNLLIGKKQKSLNKLFSWVNSSIFSLIWRSKIPDSFFFFPSSPLKSFSNYGAAWLRPNFYDYHDFQQKIRCVHTFVTQCIYGIPAVILSELGRENTMCLWAKLHDIRLFFHWISAILHEKQLIVVYTSFIRIL